MFSLKPLKNLLFALPYVLGVLAGGCSDPDEPSGGASEQAQHEVAKAPRLTFAAADSIARTVFAGYLGMETGDVKSNSRSGKTDELNTEVRILRTSAFNRAIPDSAFYVVNASDRGFVLLASDATLNENVYAYSDEGSFPEEINPGLQIWLDMAYKNSLIAKRKATDSIFSSPRRTPALPWNDPTLFPIEYFQGHECYHMQCQQHNDRVTPLLNTEWSQRAPYNNDCPIIGAHRAIAGCVPIAIAQIGAYKRSPNPFDGRFFPYASMTSKHRADSLPTFIQGKISQYIAQIGDSLEAVYGLYSTSTLTVKIYPGLCKMGFECDNFSLYDGQRIRDSLREQCPVYMQGDNGHVGHGWVVDGYDYVTTADRYYTTADLLLLWSNDTYQMYLHMNWGWGMNNGNGTYLFWTPDDQIMYPNNIKIITNIR